MKFLAELYKRDRMMICDQEDLSNMTGIPFNVIKNIESGRKKVHPEHKEFIAICDALGLNIRDYFGKDTKVIMALAQKGGSTKTSTISCTAYALAQQGYKILLVDTDLQANLTQTYCILPDDEKNFYNAFVNIEDISKHIRPTTYDNIDIVTSHDKLVVIDRDILKIDFSEYVMTDILKNIKEESVYDFIMIDVNPSLNALNVSCLMATDGLIIPLVPSSFGKNGLDLIVDFYESIKPRANNLNLLGVVINRHDMRKKRPKEVIQVVKEKFGRASMVFNTFIPEDQNVDTAQDDYEPVGHAYPKTKASLAYEELAKEVVKRAEKI